MEIKAAVKANFIEQLLHPIIGAAHSHSEFLASTSYLLLRYP